MTTCPSGVNYMHLVDHARAYIEETHSRPWHDRLVRRLLATILPYPTRFRTALHAAQLVRPFRRLFGAMPAIGPRLQAMCCPGGYRRAQRRRAATSIRHRETRKRVAL
jgi:glycolate oxidase iron-sulfur subunit